MDQPVGSMASRLMPLLRWGAAVQMRSPPRISLRVVALLAAASIAEQWMRGFFVLLAPYGFFTPLVVVALSLALVGSGVVASILAWRHEPSRGRKAWFLAAILALVCLPWLGPYRIHGFETRVTSVSEAEWLAIADEARGMVKSSTPGAVLPAAPDLDWNRRHVRKLAESHPVLRLGDTLPKMFVDETRVRFYWGSGLFGTLGVDVVASPGEDPPAHDGSFVRRRIADHLVLVWD